MEILLLSLSLQGFFDNMYASFLQKLGDAAQVKRCKTASGALRYLEANTPDVVLVTDEGLTEGKNRAVLDKVVSYVKNGGFAIVGLHFCNFTNMDQFDQFFASFDLPWKRGDYHRTTFRYNSASILQPRSKSVSLPSPYSMKVLHVRNALPEQRIFIPVDNAQTQSHVFTAEQVDQAQAAVVGGRVGQGCLVYHGDVNGEDESTKVILTLCGL